MLGRFDEALQLSRRAVDLDPLDADSWELLADTKFFMGQLHEAAADSKKALELNPDVVAAHRVLSQIYVLQGRPHDSLHFRTRFARKSRTCLKSATSFGAHLEGVRFRRSANIHVRPNSLLALPQHM